MNNAANKMLYASTDLVPAVARRPIGIWLLVGVFMVFMQIVIGGITRLTDSGLSITEWDIIMGTIPPLSEGAWEEAFEAYRVHAHKQYTTLHAGMSLQEFKFIYFWEYFHRLWARSMGFVFAFPLLYFWWRGWLRRSLLLRLAGVIGLAATAATFGWIMVSTGLNTDRYVWVNGYALTIHLSIGVSLLAWLLWTALCVWYPQPSDTHQHALRRDVKWLLVLTGVQIVLGGVMSGTKAGLFYPHFPAFEGAWNGWLPSALLNSAHWSWYHLVHYMEHPFAAALVQVLHRGTAYLLVGLGVYWWYRAGKASLSAPLSQARWALLGVLAGQFLLGVLTVLYCVGKVPVMLGVMHQGGAMMLLAVLLLAYKQMRPVT